MNVYKLSGRALKHGVRERWSHANPGFMQIDDGLIVDDDGFVTHVRGEPIDEERIYRVAGRLSRWSGKATARSSPAS